MTIHYDPGSWPHWHWRAEIVGSERADYETGMAITRAGANREAKRAARKMMALPRRDGLAIGTPSPVTICSHVRSPRAWSKAKASPRQHRRHLPHL